LAFLIVVSFNKPEQALEYYAKRWQIETLFRGLKSNGFILENTHVTRLDSDWSQKETFLILLYFRPDTR
jgi:transposase